MYARIDLLSQRELKVLDTIDAAVTRKYRFDSICSGIGDEDFKRGPFMAEVSAMDENLKAIIKRMNELDLSKENVVKVYPLWRKNRIECIAKLKQIAKSLDKDRLNFNIAKLCGLCISITGVAGLLASGIDVGLPEGMDIASFSLTAAGSGIVLGASISETVRLARKVKKAKKLIKKDQALFQEIGNWLQEEEVLQESLIDVLNIDILKGILDDTKKFVRKAKKINNEKKRLKLIEKNIQVIINKLGEDTNIPLTAIVMIPRIFTTVVLLLCKTESRLVFDFASVTFKSVAAVASLTKNSIVTVSLTSSLGLHSAKLLGLATGIVGITLDAIGIVKVCVDIHRKSRSPEAKKITIAAEEFEKEGHALDTLFRKLSEREEYFDNKNDDKNDTKHSKQCAELFR